MESSKVARGEFAPSLQYSDNRIVSGYPLRVKLNPTGQIPGSFTTTSSSITFDMAGTYVDQYLKNTSMDIQYSIPPVPADVAIAANDSNGIPRPYGSTYIRAVLKQIPIRAISIVSKTGVVLSQLNNLIYMAPLQFYGNNKHVLSNNPHETYGNYERTILHGDTANAMIVNHTYNLAKCVKSFFDTEVLAPLTEIVTVTVDLCRIDEMSYLIQVTGSDTTANTAVEVKKRILSRKYKPSNLTALTDNTLANVQIAMNESFAKSNQPVFTRDVTSQLATSQLNEIITVGGADLPINKCEFYGNYEKNQAVKLMLKGLLNEAERNNTKLQIPFHNILSQRYTINGNGSYSLTHRVTSNVGRYLKSLYITFCRQNDSESLTRDGGYNVANFGTWRIQTFMVSRDGENLLNFDASRNSHEALPFGFSSNEASDNYLENQYLPDSTLPSISSNNGRHRCLLKNNIMFPIYFDTASDPMYGKNSSIVAGLPVHGDISFAFDITLVNIDPTNGTTAPPTIAMVIFQEGIRYLAIDNSGVGLAQSELRPIVSPAPMI